MEDPALVLTLSIKMKLPHNDDTILLVQAYDVCDLIVSMTKMNIINKQVCEKQQKSNWRSSSNFQYNVWYLDYVYDNISYIQ